MVKSAFIYMYWENIAETNKNIFRIPLCLEKLMLAAFVDTELSGKAFTQNTYIRS